MCLTEEMSEPHIYMIYSICVLLLTRATYRFFYIHARVQMWKKSLEPSDNRRPNFSELEWDLSIFCRWKKNNIEE